MKLPRALREQMLAHVQSCLPEEACGILGGRGEVVYIVVEIENELHSPVKFRMCAEQQLQAFLSLERDGLELTGIWHSHPAGPTQLSASDIAEAFYPGAALLVWSRPEGQEQDWQLRAFRIDAGRVVEERINEI